MRHYFAHGARSEVDPAALLAGALIALLAACSAEDSFRPCTTDSDCGQGRRCVGLRCEAAPDFAVPVDASVPVDSSPPASDFSSPDLCYASGDCPFGTKPCGYQGCQLRCIASDWCCTDLDCPAMGQTCLPIGRCLCPVGFKVCARAQACIDNSSCCTNADCPGKLCLANGTCAIPSCSDGILNGNETDVDCGGGFCAKCLAGRSCGIDLDCRNNACMGMRCVDKGYAARSYGGGAGPAWIHAVDLDGDGDPDLVTSNVTSNNVSVLLGRGDGHFTSLGSFDAGVGPVFVTSGDLDGDRPR